MKDITTVGIKRLVIGRFFCGRWQTEEIVTKHASRAEKNPRRCQECGHIIFPPAEYYSDRIYYVVRGDYGLPIIGYRKRKHHHVVCARCWRGEMLAASGGFTKFVDRSRPRGRRILGVKPFRAHSSTAHVCRSSDELAIG